ncbi:MAG: aminotransferase class III-fold pyridoxal phosphate-dependent enzyme [Bacteroidota bacterium]
MQLFQVYSLFDMEPVKGQGCYVSDQNGQSYLDCYGGHAVISIGHSHPHFVQRISEQLEQLAFYSNSIQNPLQLQLAKLLGQQSGCKDYQLFLCNSGAEAIENALKLASFQNGKSKIVSFKQAFHGRTSAAVNITDHPKLKAPINKRFPTEFVDMNDLEAVEQAFSAGDVCALIIEGIQGIGGVHQPDVAFLQELSRLCKQYEVVFIVDEIQSGYGRSGHFFAFQQAGVEPDLITVAKGMGNGFPIGGLLIHPKFKPSYGLLGSTFGGNHLACAAGLAVLEVIRDEQLMSNAQIQGNYLMQQLKALGAFQEVRGQGLMIGLELNQAAAPLRKHLLYEEKIFTGSSSNPNVLRILPPLTISPTEIDLFVAAMERSLAALSIPILQLQKNNS